MKRRFNVESGIVSSLPKVYDLHLEGESEASDWDVG